MKIGGGHVTQLLVAMPTATIGECVGTPFELKNTVRNSAPISDSRTHAV
jgi:hypothetical protein